MNKKQILFSALFLTFACASAGAAPPEPSALGAFCPPSEGKSFHSGWISLGLKAADLKEKQASAGHITDVGEAQVLLHFPAGWKPQDRRAALCIFPGGGYAIQAIEKEGCRIAGWAAEHGMVGVIVKYRVSGTNNAVGRFPGPLLDARQALRTVRENASSLGIDPLRIGVMGFSAGGHLAANLATSVGDEDIREQGGMDPDAVRPNALMLSYPVITAGKYAHRGSFQCLLGDQAHNQALLDKFSIEKHIDAKTPPVFVWHTMTDDAVPVENTLMLIQACRAAGVSIEAHLFPEGSHGLSLANAETAGNGFYAHIVECVQCWPDLAEAWLRRLF